MIPPSLPFHIISGGTLLLAFWFLVFNISKVRGYDTYHIFIIIILFSIGIGVHAISHAILEKQYDYYPYNILYYSPKK
jgi:hypothetical protein